MENTKNALAQKQTFFIPKMYNPAYKLYVKYIYIYLSHIYSRYTILYIAKIVKSGYCNNKQDNDFRRFLDKSDERGKLTVKI